MHVTYTVYIILYGRGETNYRYIKVVTYGIVYYSWRGNIMYNYEKDERDRIRSNLNSASLSLWSSIRHSRYWSGDRFRSTLQYGRRDKIVAFNTQLSSGFIILRVSKRSNGQTCCSSSQIIVRASSFIYILYEWKNDGTYILHGESPEGKERRGNREQDPLTCDDTNLPTKTPHVTIFTLIVTLVNKTKPRNAIKSFWNELNFWNESLYWCFVIYMEDRYRRERLICTGEIFMKIFGEMIASGDCIDGFLGQWWRFLKPWWIEADVYEM